MLFISKTKTDFMPQLFLQDRSSAEVVEEFKLLGIILSSDLKWKKNTKNMIRKAYKRMWMINRPKMMGASSKQQILTYV